MLNSVKVKFNNSKYDYETSVSSQATKESCEKYFIGQDINVGDFENDNMQKCIGIEFNQGE